MTGTMKVFVFLALFGLALSVPIPDFYQIEEVQNQRYPRGVLRLGQPSDFPASENYVSPNTYFLLNQGSRDAGGRAAAFGQGGGGGEYYEDWAAGSSGNRVAAAGGGGGDIRRFLAHNQEMTVKRPQEFDVIGLRLN